MGEPEKSSKKQLDNKQVLPDPPKILDLGGKAETAAVRTL